MPPHSSAGGLLKVIGSLAAVGIAGTIAATAAREMDKRDKQQREKERWPAADRNTALDSEKQIELHDDGVVNLEQLKSDRLYARSCALRGFDQVGRNSGEFRGKCWCAILDSENFLSTVTTPINRNDPHSTLYYSLLAEDATPKAEESIAVIRRDINRTKIHVGSFDNEEAASHALYNVLSAYAKHDSETGYCQGLNMVAAYLLTKLDEQTTYWFLYTLMTNRFYNLRIIYAEDLDGLLLFKYQFNRIFAHHLPKLYRHFEVCGIHADILVEWWMTLFTMRQMPRSALDRIFDMYIVDGFKALHRATLAILSQSEESLLGFDMVQIYEYLKALPDHGVLDPDLLIATALNFTDVNETLLDNLATQYKRIAKPAEQPPSSTAANANSRHQD